ncbi:unnamed protein product [Chilo suppressalis]|uniref:CRAL-TRIO domain-containing protein n=1 Tax=Chilo suppressalis TaxID=168631 RepID=A0ABN8LB62_CHISP|nr:hypothetical protein evm_006546 [Chilo suppressalis]CAH2988927.1 unnamed protein product [Chilo suppressalis]
MEEIKMVLEIDSDGAPYVMWGKNKMKLENMPLTEKSYKEKAAKELREEPEIVKAALEELRQLLRGEASLTVPIDNDEFLMKFLRPCKFYAESAFKRIKAYYKFRLAYSEHCFDLRPGSVRSTFEKSIVSVLSPRDQHGRRILLVQSENWNPRDVPLTEVFRGIQVALEAAIVEPRTQVCGVVTILDMRGLSFAQIMQFTPSFAKMMVDWIQDCVPIRLKAVHVINQPYIFNMLFAVFKPFLREKLRSRIHFHGSSKPALLAHIEESALRKRHGGTLPEPDVPGELLIKCLLHYEDQFKLVNSYGYVNSSKSKS